MNKFLEDHYQEWLVFKATGEGKHWDNAFRKELLEVCKNFDTKYNFTLWCNDCVADAFKFAYTQYEKENGNNLNEGVKEMTFPEVKPKKNGKNIRD